MDGRFDQDEYKPDIASNEEFSILSTLMGVIRSLSDDLKLGNVPFVTPARIGVGLTQIMSNGMLISQKLFTSKTKT